MCACMPSLFLYRVGITPEYSLSQMMLNSTFMPLLLASPVDMKQGNKSVLDFQAKLNNSFLVSLHFASSNQ